MLDWFGSLPVAVQAAFVSGFMALGAVQLKAWYDNRNKRMDHRLGDEATYRQDEREFRRDYLKELQQCKDNVKALQTELNEKAKASAERDEKLRRVEWQMERLCLAVKQVLPDFDDSICREFARERMEG